MKTFTVAEAQKQLSQIIADVNRGEYIVRSDGDQKVTLCPGTVLDPEEDSPELEAELLKSIDEPLSPYSANDFGEIGKGILKKLGKE
jgi:hypothetical protein